MPATITNLLTFGMKIHDIGELAKDQEFLQRATKRVTFCNDSICEHDPLIHTLESSLVLGVHALCWRVIYERQLKHVSIGIYMHWGWSFTNKKIKQNKQAFSFLFNLTCIQIHNCFISTVKVSDSQFLCDISRTKHALGHIIGVPNI